MAESSNLIRVLDWVGIGTCVILILIDLRIKNDLIHAAIRLENRLNDGNGKHFAAEFTDIYGDIPPSVPDRLPNHSDSKVEDGGDMESIQWEVPPPPAEPPKRRPRNGSPRVPRQSE